MKHAAFVQHGDGEKLKLKVEEWIEENRESILEIIDIEYEQNGGDIYTATITFFRLRSISSFFFLENMWYN